MKIETNFADPVTAYASLLGWGTAIVAGAVVVAGLWFALQTREMAAELPALREKIERLAALRADAAAAPAPRDAAAEAELLRKIARANTFFEAGGRNLPFVLARLEEAMPAGVAATRLQYETQRRELRLSVEALSADELGSFVSGLEIGLPGFSVALNRQRLDPRTGRSLLDFSITEKRP